jgi:hypothetical protein
MSASPPRATRCMRSSWAGRAKRLRFPRSPWAARTACPGFRNVELLGHKGKLKWTQDAELSRWNCRKRNRPITRCVQDRFGLMVGTLQRLRSPVPARALRRSAKAASMVSRARVLCHNGTVWRYGCTDEGYRPGSRRFRRYDFESAQAPPEDHAVHGGFSNTGPYWNWSVCLVYQDAKGCHLTIKGLSDQNTAP